jgi:hypothetical protein
MDYGRTHLNSDFEIAQRVFAEVGRRANSIVDCRDKQIAALKVRARVVLPHESDYNTHW